MSVQSTEQTSLACLPDGTLFGIWKDRTDYGKAYYVDQQHPEAADENPGSEDAPFLTIQRAAEVVAPGEKVLIKTGIYREWIRPRRGGTGMDGMISFEAAPGARAIISGSRVLEGRWELSRWPARISVNSWMTRLPEEFFTGDHPFAQVNTTEEDFEIMRWARAVRGKVPHTLRRAMVFQNGRRLTQLSCYGDMHRVPGSFWVDAGEQRLHVNPFGRSHPDTQQFEVTERQYLFKPMLNGMGFLRIKGLTFEHAGNGFVRSGNGAVNTWGGHHWIIEANTVRQINAVGVEIGAWTDEHVDRGPVEELEERTGDHIVRGNHVHDCGTGGIQGTVVARSLVAGNHIHDCGWQEAEPYWETAGIKILYTNSALVQGNHIHHCYAAPGIWIDFMNRNTRVCRNLVHHISSYHGGIFFEASNAPNLIDNNIVHQVNGSGIYQHDCDLLLIAHNLVFDCSTAGIRMLKNKDRDRVGLGKNNRVINNIVAECAVPVDYFDSENSSDHNIFAGLDESFDLEAWRARGLDRSSRVANIEISVDPAERSMAWSARTDEDLRVPRHELLSSDFFGRPHPEGKEVSPGPFTEGWTPTTRRLLVLPGECSRIPSGPGATE